jgi:hypothetical protein
MKKTRALWAAAVAGIVGAAGVAVPSSASAAKKDKKMEASAATCGGMKSGSSDVNCYGVNKCKGAGKCGGEGSACAGSNSCKGRGWLPMPKDSCLSIDGGSTEPVKKG